MYRSLLALILSLLLTGCGLNENKGILMAAGSYGDLAVIVSDDQLRPTVNRFLSTFNDTETFVIQEEPRFKADILSPGHWDLCKGYKNVLFVVRLGDGGDAEKAARRLVSDEAMARLTASNGGIVQINDPWSTYQLAVVVASPDRNSLGSILRNNGERLRGIIEDSNRERILRHYRYEGLHTDLMNDYWRRYGFFLEIPRAYQQNQMQPDGFPAVELMCTAPSRGITVSWHACDDPVAALADTAYLTELREEVGRRLHNEEIMPTAFVWQPATVDGREAVKLKGAWNSTRFSGGGAFWCYFVPDPEHRRMLCLDLLAYAPGMDKMLYFRRLDAIASTFSLTRPQP